MTAALAMPPFVVRPETPDDRHYVLSTWRRAEQSAQHVRRSRGATRPLSIDEQRALQRFSDAHVAMTGAVLGRASTRILIAHPPEDDTTIAGWLCCRPAVQVIRKGPYAGPVATPAPIVYYVFVRDEVRRFGVARMLLGELLQRNDVLYTCEPRAVMTRPRGWVFEPRAAFVEVS